MLSRFKSLPTLAATAGLLALVGCCDFEISTKTVPSGTVNQPYSYNLDTKCGDADWRTVSGQLPPGLGLDRKGKLAGTPSLAGSYTFTLEAVSKSNPDNDVISQGYAVVINAGAVPAGAVPAGATVGVAATPAAPVFAHRVVARYGAGR